MKFIFVVLLLLLLGFTFLSYSQKVSNTLITKNGTYFGKFQYKHNTYFDASYIRIEFLNDSTFAFSIVQDSPESEVDKNLNFISSQKGIGRFVTFKGEKIWAGIIDDASDYKQITDSMFLITSHSFSIKQALEEGNFKQKSDFDFNRYMIVQFIFKDNYLNIEIIKSYAGPYFIAKNYKKIDSKKMDYSLNSSYFKNRYDKGYFDDFIYYQASLKKLARLQSLPIADRIEGNKIMANIKSGEIVRINPFFSIYMKYTCVYQFGKDHVISKYGWISRDQLNRVQEIRVRN